MSAKSWIIPYLGTAVGVGFTIITFITGQEINPTHVSMLDYLLYLTLGSGAIGAANAGYTKYSAYKSKTP